MTYLELINGVLRRMREDTVSSPTQSTYSTMIGDLVNDAKTIVEQAWDWSALRGSIDVTTADSTTNYSLTGSGSRFKVMGVYNTTSLARLTHQTTRWMDKQQQINSTTPSTAPSYYTFRDVDSSGDLTVDLYPTPDGVYTIKFNGVIPQADLSDGADILSVPSQPVLHLALAMATRERGETGGQSAQEQFALAQQFLNDAISLDAARHPIDSDWYFN